MTDGLKAAVLPNRAVIRVSGEDARPFLDGLITNAMAAVAPGRAVHAALLSPQGKIISDFFVTEAETEDGGGFHLDAPLINVSDLAKRLGFYRLRARVDIAEMGADYAVVALWDGPVEPDALGLAFADPRLAVMGWRAVVHRTQADALMAEARAVPADASAYHAWRIGSGLAEPGLDYLPGEVFPHEINMDQLHGVDFTKGCYVGQEVVSRMQHRGTARTRIVPLAYAGGFVVGEGAPVIAGGKPLGRTCSGADGRGIALIRLDRAADAVTAGDSITAGGVEATFTRPSWWRADWPIGRMDG